MSSLKIKESVVEIGRIIRRFREQSGRNLSDVAAEAAISTSMLSQIERAVVSPSIDTLFHVCDALHMDIGGLFSRLQPQSRVRIAHPRGRLATSSRGVRYEQLAVSPDPSHPAELFLLTMEPGSSLGIEERGHEGIEMGYVLEGEAALHIEQSEQQVRRGDSLTFSSHLPHRLSNHGSLPFRAVWAVLPPQRDYLELT